MMAHGTYHGRGSNNSYVQNYLNRRQLVGGVPVEGNASDYEDEDDMVSDHDEMDYEIYPNPHLSRNKALTRPYEDAGRFEASKLREAKDTGPNKGHGHKKFSKRGRLVTFYRNDDPHFKGIQTAVSQKCFVSFETLLSWLTEKIPLTKGVRHVFSLPEGREITDVKDFVGGKDYVVSNDKKIRLNVQYGNSKEQYWNNRKPSAGKFRKHEKQLFLGENGDVLSTSNPSPRILSIMSNTHRNSIEKVILNPKTNQTFEEMLEDITAMLKLLKPPVTSLYTAKEPFRKVQSFSQLHRDFKDHDLFIACGREGRPKEMLTNAFSKREAPSSNSSNDSLITGQAALRKPKKIRRPNIPDYESNPSFVRSVSPVTPQPARGNSHPNIATRSRIPKPRTKAIIKAGRSVTPQFSKPEGVGKKKTQRLGKRLDHSVDVIKVDIHGRRREFYPPTLSDGNIDDGERPDKKLKLDWVYGYRGHDARNNLYVLPSNELLYYVAAVAIVYDKQRELQRHYTGHNEDISSMALHPNETYVATAQLAGETADTAAHIRVWDVRSLSTYAIIGLGVFQVGLSSLDFSAESEGEYLMAIDEGERHVMSVWNWQDEKMLAKTTLTNAPKHSLDDEEDTSIETVIWGCFHPQDDTTLVTYGEEHIHFWKIFWDSRSKTAKILRDKKSGFFKEDPPKFVTAIAFSASGDVITGDSSGRILVWSRDSADAYVINTRCSESMRRAHRKTVFALCMLEDGTLLSGAGDEIKAWDSSDKYRNIRDRTIPESAGYVRTLVPQSLLTADDTLFVGTTKNIVLEGSLQHKFRAVVQGHVEEVWTAAISPSEHAFVTAGHDMMVCKWSAVSHKMLWKVYVDSACWASAYHPEGHTVVIGTETGQVIVLNANNGSQLASFNASHEKIQTVQYSPDGAMLAIGCHDNTIYVFDVLEKRRSYRRHGQGFLRGHKNFVLNLDWSRDSGFLRSVSGDCDTLFWNVNSMQQEKPAKSLRDVDWHTHNCILGYHVIGAWSNLVEGEDLSCTARSHYRDYLAVGDTEGAVRLYKYPCAAHKPEYYEKKHYSSNVTSVGFLFDDSYVISTGGVDAGVMQFAVVEPLTPR